MVSMGGKSVDFGGWFVRERGREREGEAVLWRVTAQGCKRDHGVDIAL